MTDIVLNIAMSHETMDKLVAEAHQRKQGVIATAQALLIEALYRLPAKTDAAAKMAE